MSSGLATISRFSDNPLFPWTDFAEAINHASNSLYARITDISISERAA
jgi:hypothetical protein